MKKNINISLKPLNKALDRCIKDRDLSNEDVVRRLGVYTAAAIGNYRKGKREVPTGLVIKWKEHYGDDLMAIAETIVSTDKTSVSRETETNVSKKPTIRDPWDTVDRLTESFTLNSQIHKAEVDDLRKDKNELWEMIRFLRTNRSPHKTK